MQCIHYGNDHFDKSWMQPVKNDVNFTKSLEGYGHHGQTLNLVGVITVG